MKNTTLIFIIIGSICLGLGLIFLIIFSTIFLIKRHYINQDYKLKTKYNYYHNMTIGSNIKAIEAIASKNHRLLPILNFLNDYRKTYEKQLEIVKVKLRGLSNLLQTYKLGEIKNAIKQIKFNFEQLDKQQEEYKKFNLDTQKYSNNVSEIATKLFAIVNSIGNFNKDNMLEIVYKDVSEFKEINKQVNANSQKINEQLETINDEVAHRLFLQELYLSKNYLNFSKKIYEINEFHIALDAIINEIKIHNEKIDNNSNILFFKKLKTAKNKSDELIKNITNENIDQRIDEYKHEINKLEKDLRDIRLNYSYQELVKNNLSKFEDYLDNFFKIINQHHIKDLCRDILIHFNNDEKIKELALNDINLAKAINDKLQIYENLKHQKENNYEKNNKLIKCIIEIYHLMISFKENNDILFNKISEKNKDLLALTFKINDVNLKLIEIQQLIDDNKIKNQEVDEKIAEYQQFLKNTIHTLSNDILTNNEDIKKELDAINDFINDTLLLIKNKKEIMQIVKQLRLYANRFLTKDNTKQFKEFDKLQKEGKYYDLIDEYIIFINRSLKNKKVS